MKLSNLLSLLPLAAASSITPRCPSKHPAPNVPEECCCLTYKAACTMNMERMLHVKLFYNRKQGISPEEFNRYWANDHAALATPFHLRIGVVKYSQVRTMGPVDIWIFPSITEFRDLIRVPGGLPVLEFDGAVEMWVPNIEVLQTMNQDPEYVNKIQPDEANFIDLSSMRMIIGVDYIVVENQNAVMDHGRKF
ncbi:hypothetical protein HJFPF1_08562 [Paramyrothecium foliicola]|nr:hypothetical protein HJFPF1_08562 [Paramyrothecium foliicola]